MDIQNGEGQLKDGWGNPLRFKRDVSPQAIAYTVSFSGRDQVFDTKDDMDESQVNFNKSRIVGDYLGTKAKEGWTGLKAGFGRKSEFEEN